MKARSSSHSRGKAKYVESEGEEPESVFDVIFDEDSSDVDSKYMVIIFVKGFKHMGFKKSN